MLSEKDKKNLSQKALKVSEEGGELAKVILPYDNADGTTHRFVEKTRILEESVDTILSAISIPYSLGFTHDEIFEMMQRKAEYWQSLQAKEAKVEYPIPYEIHITVSLVPEETMKKAYEMQVKMFKHLCERLQVKPIILDLENDGEVVMKDVMTSSKHIGNNASAYEEAQRIVRGLEYEGFLVVRSKIETVPWHPAAPINEGDQMPKDCYFEAHIGCLIDVTDKEALANVAKNNDAHLSRNFFKKLEDGKFVNMITLRKYNGTYDDFLWHLENLKDNLNDNGFEFEKVITEFSIYDTKVSHDYQWLEKKVEV